ncbi:MAG: hypothetical protein E7Z86_06750 [Methanosphaera stadtmanae]|nr:hypothetical protein [Bacillota bacterium]MBE6488394.1 hypothetical protein [Methanosphaera stadtmanae]
MEKIYNFRDKNDLLEHIDKGKKSSYIREALETKLEIDKKAYASQLEIKSQIIKNYKQNIDDIEGYIHMLYNEQNNMERLSENLYRKLNENIKEYHMIKQLLEKKNNIEDQQDKREFETLEKTVTTLLRSRHDEDIKIDLGFFKHYGNFKSKLYFKQSLLSFIDRYIKEGEMFAGEYISSDDINYMKEIIKEYD